MTPKIWFFIVLAGTCAGLAVFFGFKAAETSQEDKQTKSFYVKITALLAGLSLALQCLLTVAM